MTTENLEDEVVHGPSGEERLGERVGTGGEGTVYRLQDTPSEVAKIFEPEKRGEKADKVRAMIDRPPIDPTYEHKNRRSIIWPTAIVEDPATGEFLGYRMPYKNLEEQENVQRYARRNLQWDDSEPEVRYKTALNLAIVVDAIHQQGHAMGDMNHQNILVKDGFVSLIDCDAFHIKGTQRTYGGDVFFPRYTPPEGRGNTLTAVRRSDQFGLGIHIFQLLMEGFHPFQATGSAATGGSLDDMINGNRYPYENPCPGKLVPHDMAPEYESLPSAIRGQFSKCFVSGKTQPMVRPMPQTWIDTLEEASGLADDERWEGSSGTQETSKSGTGSETARATGNGRSSEETKKSTEGKHAEGSSASTTNATGETTTTKTKTTDGASGATRGRNQGHGRDSVRNSRRRASSSSSSSRRRKAKVTRTAASIAAELKRTLFYLGGLLVIAMVAYVLLMTM